MNQLFHVKTLLEMVIGRLKVFETQLKLVMQIPDSRFTCLRIRVETHKY